MRIIVKDKGKTKIWLPIPTFFVTSKFILRRIIKHVDESKNLSGKQIDKLVKAIRRAKKKFGRLELVNVKSKDGTLVRIIL